MCAIVRSWQVAGSGQGQKALSLESCTASHATVSAWSAGCHGGLIPHQVLTGVHVGVCMQVASCRKRITQPVCSMCRKLSVVV